MKIVELDEFKKEAAKIINEETYDELCEIIDGLMTSPKTVDVLNAAILDMRNLVGDEYFVAYSPAFQQNSSKAVVKFLIGKKIDHDILFVIGPNKETVEPELTSF